MYSWDKELICHIVGGGDFRKEAFLPKSGDMIIAADSGYRYLEEMKIVPDLVLGDFDSLGEKPDHPHVLCLPVEKDDTDMMYAVRVGLEKGHAHFCLHGSLGGERLDHTLANIQTLLYLTMHGAKGILLGGDGTVITAVQSDRLEFPENSQGTLSVFCMGERAEGVTLSGVKYPLENHTLTYDFPLGVSNEFTGVPAVISVRNGTLLLVWREEL